MATQSKKNSTSSKAKPRTSRKPRQRISPPSPSLAAEGARWIAELFPQVAAEGRIDFDKLRTSLGDEVDARPERYRFTWAGERDAIQLMQMPSRGTLRPDEKSSVDFARTSHTFIEGDNLEVLKLLYKSYFGRIKMIYIDPPYNTGGDFIYRDNYADPLDAYLGLTRQIDEEGNLLTSNPETSGRFHSAWLSMMYPRLFLARQMLRNDGVIFVSIDDHEVHHLRLIMDEIFGQENFVGQIAVQLNPRGRHLDRFVAKTHEYLVVYARDASEQVMYQLAKDERMTQEYNKEDDRGRYRELELRNRNPAYNSRTRPNLYYPIYADPDEGSVSLKKDGKHTVEVLPKNSRGGESCWTWGKPKFRQNSDLLLGRQTTDGGWRVFRKDYLVGEDGEAATTLPKALWTDKEINNDYGKKALQDLFEGKTVFDFPKSPALIEKMLLIGTQKDDIVLDFFAGSATTAQAVLELNRQDGNSRRFILVQLPEPAPEGSPPHEAGFADLADVGKERIRRVIDRLKAQTEAELDLGKSSEEDLGFKTFKLGPSNFKPWKGVEEPDPDTYAEQMEWFEDSLVESWKSEDVIWEVAFREGYSLESRFEKVDDAEKNVVWRVRDESIEQSFLICLDDKLNPDTPKSLSLTPEDLFVCRDAALDDGLAANLALQCRLKTI